MCDVHPFRMLSTLGILGQEAGRVGVLGGLGGGMRHVRAGVMVRCAEKGLIGYGGGCLFERRVFWGGGR